MLKRILQISAARWLNWLYLLGYFVVFLTAGDWDKPPKNGGVGLLSSDTFEYYSYLSTTFIDGDPFYRNWEESQRWDHSWAQKTPGGTGNTVKMTMGMSMLYAPFFGAAHLSAKIFGFPADGYSYPYQFGIFFCVLFWLGIGLYCLRKVLEANFSPVVVILTLMGIILASNINWYIFIRAGISHPFAFSFSAILLYLVPKWYVKPQIGQTIIIACAIGMLALIRPVNILFAGILIFWGIQSKAAVLERLQFFRQEWKLVLLIPVFAFLVILPQLIFWKLTTGSFFYYTYKEEGFFFANPQFYQAILGYRNGWLRYTPIMVLALIGIPLLWFKMREWFWLCIAFVPIYIYVVVSWWCWWYIGYGNRAMIDMYAILALPLASLIAAIGANKFWRKALMSAVILLLVAHNTFQTVQARMGILHSSAMSKRAYWKTFLSLEKPKDYQNDLQFPDVKAAKLGLEVVVEE